MKIGVGKFLSTGLILTMTLALALTGCGNKATTNTTTTTTAVAPATTEKVAPKVDIDSPKDSSTITLLSARSAYMEVIANSLKDANSVKNINVNAKLVGWDQLIEQSSLALSSGGKSPYEAIAAYNRTLVEYSSKGWLLPLDDLVAKYKDKYELGDIPKELWDSVTYDGHIYGLPIAQNVEHFFYRKDILEKNNVKVPTTYEELIAACKALKGKDTAYPLGFVVGKPSGIFTEFNNALLANGGKWFDDNDKPLFNGAEGVNAAETLKELISFMPPTSLTSNNDAVMLAMQTGEIAMSLMWTGRAAAMEDPKVSKVMGKVAFAPALLGEAKSTPGTNFTQDMFVIPKKTAVDPDLIFQVLCNSISKENLKKNSDNGMVSRTSILEDKAVIAKHPNLKEANITIKAGAKSYPKKAYMGIVTTIVGNNLSNAMAGSSSIKEALDKAAKECTEEMKKQGYTK